MERGSRYRRRCSGGCLGSILTYSGTTLYPRRSEHTSPTRLKGATQTPGGCCPLRMLPGNRLAFTVPFEPPHPAELAAATPPLTLPPPRAGGRDREVPPPVQPTVKVERHIPAPRA